MPNHPSFPAFEKELNRLVATFEKNFAHYKKAGYDEASLRQEFLNPLFSALGWDVENKAGHIPQKREVEVESRTQIGGRAKRADYLFRTDGRDRFVCEAKKPAEDLGDRPAFQAKRYAWNKDLPLAVLTDFEEMKIFIVGGRPYLDEPEVGRWETWHYKQYPLVAQELWNLLARENAAAGSIDKLIESLPKKKPTGKGKAKQQWLIKPDRSRALDHEFLEFLDGARRDLASDLYKNNDHATLLEGNLLNESVQCILDRILFLRICEDRDIDTGGTLHSIVETWRRNYGHDEGRKLRQESLRMREDSMLDLDDDGRGGGGGSNTGGRIAAPRESLWHAVVRHFRALDRRPPSHVPFFNGNLFKQHGSERLLVGDAWLADFIGELSDDETPYLFNVIPVEILGSVYERFLGKVVRPQGRGIIVEEKPEVRKAGGVYYTPRYIVDYIVEQTVGRQLDAVAGISAVSNDSQRLENRAASVPKGQRKLAGGVSHRIAAQRGRTPAGVPEPHAQHSSAPAGAHASGDGDPVAASAAGGLAHRLISVQPSGLRGTATLSLPAFEKATAALRILDPACGSGSFLIRAFERVCEHWQEWLTAQLPQEKPARTAWEKKHRKLCWVDAETGDIHLTVDLKRRILTGNIYGVDLDSAAVEVTQLSLYLKMLENENRTTLQRERELFADEVALLPPLQDNIKCGNSLIASDFSMMSDDLVRVNAFDWEIGFREIMKAGGFDAVIGNPPYIPIETMEEDERGYYQESFPQLERKYDTGVIFILRALRLIKPSGFVGYISSITWETGENFAKLRQLMFTQRGVAEVINLPFNTFADAYVDTGVYILCGKPTPEYRICRYAKKAKIDSLKDADPIVVSTSLITAPDFRLVLDPNAQRILIRACNNAGFKALGEITKSTQGLAGDRFQRAPSARSSEWYAFGEQAQSYRYEFYVQERSFAYMRDNPSLKQFYEAEPKILIRRIINRQDRLDACYCDEQMVFKKDINPFILTVEKPSPKFVLGILNSRLLSYFYVNTSAIATKDDFRQTTLAELRRLPLPFPDFTDRADKARHDKLVMLVEKMLALTPKLRAAKTDAEKATLRNAVSKTDQDIDALVYELYAITPEEIALVEGQA